MDQPTTPRIPTQNDTPGDDRVAFHIDNGSEGSPAQRLARALHFRKLGDPTQFDPADLDDPAKFVPLDPATLDQYTAADTINPRLNPETIGDAVSPERVTALVGMDDAGTTELLDDLLAARPDSPSSMAAELSARVADIAQTLGDHADRQDDANPDQIIDLDAGTTLTPNYHPAHDAAARLRLTSGDLRTLAVRLLAAGLVIIVGMAIGVGAAPKAEAAAYTLAPVRIVISGPVTPITIPAISTATTHGQHIATLTAPQDGHHLIVAAGTSTGPLLTIRGRQTSTALTVGTQTWQLWDAGDDSTRDIPVQVVRQSRVTLDPPAAFPGGIILTGRAVHYDPKTNAYAGDQLSTVMFALRNAVTGRTVKIDAPTAADGSVFAIAQVPVGGWTVTAVRAPGQTVTGATSTPRYAVASPLAPARGE